MCNIHSSKVGAWEPSGDHGACDLLIVAGGL